MRILWTLACTAAFLFATSNVQAVKPGEEVNPNGFPSGTHYNLNIHGKAESFSCPEQEYDEFGEPIYGNSVFIPEDGNGIEIFMESGKGRWASSISELQVTDPCSGFDGDGATLQLPANSAGYRVYARALAKPTDNPDMVITPNLVSAVDELGNDLMYLGLVTDNGFVASDGITVSREKGKSRAVDITGLFEWTGDVCYFTAPEAGYTLSETCCVDLDGDLIYDDCTDPMLDDLGVSYCADAGYELLALYCQEYLSEWVFNIADFVKYLWEIDNNGSKLVQIRFYPN